MGSTSTDRLSGFWSYVHDDNEIEGGRILNLCSLLRNEYRILTGEEMQMFVDRDSISWGAKWERTIDDAVTTTTFFIAIVTPQYLKSEACRKELLLFSRNADAREVQELLLPILYTNVSGLDIESDDEVKAAIASTQYEPFFDIRLEDQSSPAYRQRVNKLAIRLVEISEQVADRPEIMPGVDGGSTPKVEGTADGTVIDEDDAPGMLDAVVDAEALFSEWNATINHFTEVMDQVAEITNRYAPKIHQAGKVSAAAKLFVAKSYAEELSPIADEFRATGAKYADQAISMNTNIVTVLTQIASRDSNLDLGPDVIGFMDQVRDLAIAGRTSFESVKGFQDSVEDVAKLSRDVRKPLRMLSQGAQSFLDGQDLFDDWVRRIDKIEGSAGDDGLDVAERLVG